MLAVSFISTMKVDSPLEINVIARAYAREDLIDDAHTGARGGHKRTDLRQQADQRRPAAAAPTTRHVRAGDHQDLLVVGVEVNIVRDELLTWRQLTLDHRMAATFDVEYPAVVHGRVYPTCRDGRERL